MTENVNFAMIGISVTANLAILIVICVIVSPLSVISVIVSVVIWSFESKTPILNEIDHTTLFGYCQFSRRAFYVCSESGMDLKRTFLSFLDCAYQIFLTEINVDCHLSTVFP